jgi:hypothetical protein
MARMARAHTGRAATRYCMDTIAEHSLAALRAILRFARAANFFVHATEPIFAGFPLTLIAFAYAAPVFTLRKFGG